MFEHRHQCSFSRLKARFLGAFGHASTPQPHQVKTFRRLKRCCCYDAKDGSIDDGTSSYLHVVILRVVNQEAWYVLGSTVPSYTYTVSRLNHFLENAVACRAICVYIRIPR